jgi:GxxExxY protein
MTENEIAKEIVDCAFKVHTTLGPGLLESVYEVALAYELTQRGLQVERQVPIPVKYGSITFEVGFRADLLVEGKVLVELKSAEANQPVHKKQLITHLRLADKRLGLVINFGLERIKDGITRLVNGLPEEPRESQAVESLDFNNPKPLRP